MAHGLGSIFISKTFYGRLGEGGPLRFVLGLQGRVSIEMGMEW